LKGFGGFSTNGIADEKPERGVQQQKSHTRRATPNCPKGMWGIEHGGYWREMAS
jgi:hypothetical protein